jgi:MFS family permease
MHARDLLVDARWLFTGFFLTLCSGFGQTYFIALFAGQIKSELSISEGEFGSLYAIATISSAALLMWVGKATDNYPIKKIGLAVIFGLAGMCLLFGNVANVWTLIIALFGLRFFGQGMLTHVSMTAMARWFNRKRGKAVSIAALGFPVGEAIFPICAVVLMGVLGWRQTWMFAGSILIVVALPVLWFLLRRERQRTEGTPQETTSENIAPIRHWTRKEVLHSPLFYALLPGVLAPSFIQTGIFFNQVVISTDKGWDLSWFAASFPVLAGVAVFASLGVGVLIDRIGSRRLLPYFLLPLGLASIGLYATQSIYVLPIAMALIGITHGSTSTIMGALWAEIYGTRNIGAIRALVMSGVVFASALSPGIIGLLLDLGVSVGSQLFVMGCYCFAASILMGLLQLRLGLLTS